MSYYTWEYSFSQFDCDAVQRAQADQFIMEASSMLRGAKAILADRVASLELRENLNSAENLLKKAEQQYSRMNYVSALQYARSAAEKSGEAVVDAKNQVSAMPIFIILGVVIGIILGHFGIPYLKKRRRESVSETASGVSPTGVG
jgi:hypothetical protein